MYIHTVKYNANDPGCLSKHLDKSGRGSFNLYSYLKGRLPDILPILGEGRLYDRGCLYGTLQYIHTYIDTYIPVNTFSNSNNITFGGPMATGITECIHQIHEAS